MKFQVFGRYFAGPFQANIPTVNKRFAAFRQCEYQERQSENTPQTLNGWFELL
jgi:hypothetical protein